MMLQHGCVHLDSPMWIDILRTLLHENSCQIPMNVPDFLTSSTSALYVLIISCSVIISPNEVSGDIMVLASRPPVDPDDVNTFNSIICNVSLSNCI